MKKKNIVIAWYSGGITSAAACYWAIQTFKEVEVVFLETGNEHPDTYRFLKDCQELYGQKIIRKRNSEYSTIEEVWEKYKSLNTANGAICSSELKRKVRQEYQNLDIHWGQVFGFEYDKAQIKRHFNMRKNYPEINVISPLIDLKMSKGDCMNFIRDKGIKVPEAYLIGFNNNNCFGTGCVQGGVGYWQKIKIQFPEKFEKMAQMEHDLSRKKGQPVTVCKDQGGEKTTLIFLKKNKDFPDIGTIDDIKGRMPQPMQECIGFCSTK